MRLTLALLKRKMPPGHIWQGKHRIAHHIYPINIERMVRRLQVEENNMLLLRHPFLTLEQEKAYDATVDTYMERLKNEKLIDASSRTRPSKRLEETFSHLLHGERWDV